MLTGPLCGSLAARSRNYSFLNKIDGQIAMVTSYVCQPVSFCYHTGNGTKTHGKLYGYIFISQGNPSACGCGWDDAVYAELSLRSDGYALL